jgi:hypothetical protein
MRRLGTFATLSALGAVSALLGGCPIWGGDSGGGTVTDGGGPDAADSNPSHCASDNDCPMNAYCDLSTHTCTAGAPCGASRACTTGYFCSARGVCEPGCNVNADCPAGDVCESNHTCAAGGQCQHDTDCPTGQACVDGSCRPNTSLCQFAYQCGPGQDCVNGACVAHCSGTGQSTCPTGQVCVGGECQYPTSTMTCATTTCPANQICVNGMCAPQCMNDNDCGMGFYCASGACRVDDRAHPFCTPPAMGCAAGSVCINGGCHISCANPMGMDPNMYCLRVDSAFPTCSLYMGQQVCTSPSELHPQCARSSDCPAGQTCVNANCQ